MIDDFLAELFQPSGPPTFDQRFSGAPQPSMPLRGPVGMPPPGMDPRMLGPLAGPGAGMPPGIPMPPMPGGGGDGMLPPGAAPMAGPAPDALAKMMGGAGGVPLPLPRPPGLGMAAPAAPVQPPMADTAEDPAPTPFQKMAGMLGGKRMQSSLAAGMSGGDPKFKAGAFSRGFGTALGGGLKSDREDRDTETATSDRDQKQKNFDRTQTERERDGEARRKLYGARAATAGQPRSSSSRYRYLPGRGEDDDGNEVDGTWKVDQLDGTSEFVPGMVQTGKDRDIKDRQQTTRERQQGTRERAQTDKEKTGEVRRGLDSARTDDIRKGKPGAWNKPPHERYKDAEGLILKKEQELRKRINPMAPKADRERIAGEVQRELEAFKQRTYKQYGLDGEGGPSGAAPGGAGPTMPKAAESGAGTRESPHKPASQQDFDDLPPGAYFINPADGKVMRKRGAQN